jgi:hypothetical protein
MQVDPLNAPSHPITPTQRRPCSTSAPQHPTHCPHLALESQSQSGCRTSARTRETAAGKAAASAERLPRAASVAAASMRRTTSSRCSSCSAAAAADSLCKWSSIICAPVRTVSSSAAAAAAGNRRRARQRAACPQPRRAAIATRPATALPSAWRSGRQMRGHRRRACSSSPLRRPAWGCGPSSSRHQRRAPTCGPAEEELGVALEGVVGRGEDALGVRAAQLPCRGDDLAGGGGGGSRGGELGLGCSWLQQRDACCMRRAARAAGLDVETGLRCA